MQVVTIPITVALYVQPLTFAIATDARPRGPLEGDGDPRCFALPDMGTVELGVECQ